ncbi:MAG: diphosphomevalonate decarboxylase [Myxococcota bacterium]|jgi:diphosphomevalonate decarboxylase
MKATAVAHPNIALIKYWGKRDIPLNLPDVPSLSITLDTFTTTTTVTWGVAADRVVVNGAEQSGRASERVVRFLDLVDPARPGVEVVSDNNFPTAAGLASSASGFAALALAACRAAGQSRTLQDLSVLSRRGSGSACRSLWGGWVLWRRGERPDGTDSHGEPVAGRDHWDVCIVLALVSSAKKPIGSTEGMIKTQQNSPLYPGWVSSAEPDITQALSAIERRDLPMLGEAMERSTLKMHATMISAGVRYWKPETVAVMECIEALRASGVAAYYTMDAGPNVKVLCTRADAPAVAAALTAIGAETRILGVGGDATVR